METHTKGHQAHKSTETDQNGEGFVRINVGCGDVPTNGWRNFDNSLSLRLSKIPVLPYLLFKVGLINASHYQFVKYARSNEIEYADATERLPLSDRSVDVLYSSHMLEHLDQTDATSFLREARRVLRSGGIIRLAVPDLRKHARRYIESGDADAFISAIQLTRPRPRTIAQRLKILLTGTRHHLWMYDGDSLCRLLIGHGFLNPRILEPGTTTIKAPGSLDLRERLSDSLYVEAVNP
jgi:predicted SAM-dependent methyltransferase